ncbi:MAG: acyl-CoA thioesterase [Paracoccaceae bacterium]
MFSFPQKVLFKHCDPAGIVFYPRYFEMMNDCVETFFDEVLNTPFEDLHKSGALPTAQIQTRFTAPSRHGDHLNLTLSIIAIGRSSAKYQIIASCADQRRFETTATLVNVDTRGEPTQWSDELGAKLRDLKDQSL